MSVDLRRPHIGVSEQLLNCSEICSSLEEVGGVGVPQGVRVQRPPIGERMTLEHSPDVAWGHTPASGVQEECGGGPGTGLWGGRQSTAPGAEVAGNGIAGGLAQREPADFCTFPEHRDRPAAQVDVADVEAATFADPEPGAVEQLHDGEISPGPRIVGLGPGHQVVEQGCRLLAPGHPGQPAHAFRGLDRRGNVAAEHPPPAQMAEIRPDRRGLARGRRAREPAGLQVGQVAPQHAMVERGRVGATSSLAPLHELARIVLVRAARVRTQGAERHREPVGVVRRGARFIGALAIGARAGGGGAHLRAR